MQLNLVLAASKSRLLVSWSVVARQIKLNKVHVRNFSNRHVLDVCHERNAIVFCCPTSPTPEVAVGCGLRSTLLQHGQCSQPLSTNSTTRVSWRWICKGGNGKRNKLALTDKIIASRPASDWPKTGRLICKGIDEEHRERREDKFDRPS